ncbi:MAG: hypothetical protein R2762_22730 [Bryobacteraceae bacterium]
MPELESQLAAIHPVYALVAGLAPGARPDAARIADIVVAEQFRTPSSLGPGEGIACLRRALEAAQPDRKCAQFILDHFAQWMQALADNGRDTFLEQFPTLAPAAADLGESGMKRVIDATNREPRKFACVAAYAMTTKDAILAMASLAAVHSIADLQRFTAAFPAERMEESRDAERLPAALARVPEALPLAASLIAGDVSAAYGTLVRLRSVERSPAYLAAFRTLVETVGLQANGWCLDTMPGLFQRLGADRMNAFVETAAGIARDFGGHAGQAFLEGRVPAGKDLLAG